MPARPFVTRARTALLGLVCAAFAGGLAAQAGLSPASATVQPAAPARLSQANTPGLRLQDSALVQRSVGSQGWLGYAFGLRQPWYPSAALAGRTPFGAVGSGRRVPSGFSGLTINDLRKVRTWPDLNPSLLRLWDTHTRWMDLEPARGTWNFAPLDAYLSLASQHGTDVIMTLGQPPAWASGPAKRNCAYGSGCQVPLATSDWRQYVHTLVAHAGGRIGYWEIWNEPTVSSFWTGTPAQLAQLTNVACREIRAGDPSAKILSPSITAARMGFFETYFDKVDKSCIDIASIHYYLNAKNFSRGGDARSFQFIDSVKDLLRRHGMGDRPIWNTEFGVACSRGRGACGSPDPGEARQATANLLRYLFIMASEGVQRTSFFFWERQSPVTPVALTQGTSLADTPAGAAYRRVMGLLGGSTISEAYQSGGVYVVRLSKGGKSYVALWAGDTPVAFAIPDGWSYGGYIDLVSGRAVGATRGAMTIPADSLVLGEG